MRFLSILIAILAVGFSIQQDAEGETIADLFQEVLDVEASLKEQLKLKWSEHQAERNQQKQAAAESLNKTITAFENVLKDKIQKIKSFAEEVKEAKENQDAEKKQKLQQFFEELEQVFEVVKTKKENDKAEKEQQFKELADQVKDIITKRKEQKKIEKEQEAQALTQTIQSIIKKWQEFLVKFDNFIAEKKQQEQQKLEDAKKSLEELKTLVQNEMQKRADRKAQKQAIHDANQDQYKSDLQNIHDSLTVEEQKLLDQYNIVKEKKDSFQKTIKDSIQDSLNFKVNSFLEDKIQTMLDKEAVKQVGENKLVYDINELVETPKLDVENRATILDEITGTSQWQTVTWILLALAILLAIALIAMIFYSVSQKNSYQRLNGHDIEAHSNERTPIVTDINPIGYNSEKKISAAGPSNLARPLTPPGPSHPSAPSGEQQF